MEFLAKSTEQCFLNIFPKKKTEQEESQMSSVTTKNTDMKNWIESRQDRLKGFLAEGYEIKTAYYISIVSWLFEYLRLFIRLQARLKFTDK